LKSLREEENISHYRGWVRNFGFKLPNGKMLEWNLNKRKEIVGLIFLAVYWNLTGYFENAVATLAELYYEDMLDVDKWKSYDFKEEMVRNRSKFERKVKCNFEKIIKHRKALSVNPIAFEGFHIVGKNWKIFEDTLEVETILGGDIPKLNAKKVMKTLSKIYYPKDVNRGRRLLLVKIPLIMRELHCAHRVNTDLNFCCVPDQRVRGMTRVMGFNIPRPYGKKAIRYLEKGSKEIF